MVPSSLLGAILFLFLLTPGLAYVLRRERVIPEARRSTFRESVQVVAASAISLFAAGLLFSAARSIWPSHTLNVRGLIQAPGTFAVGHHVELAWWSIGFLATATVLAWVAADPRIPKSRLAAWMGGLAIIRAVVGPPARIRPESAWYVLAHRYDDDPGLIHVAAQLDDGSCIVGYLFQYNIDTDEGQDRDMVLHGPLGLVAADGTRHNLGASFTVISARRIVRLDVTHLPSSADAGQVAFPDPV
ncbi:DUF6338 family protein [Micromonospora echinaurantiaca]|uniref:DUF6338 family protein n=1 Tax=Micromonospora echinaurantiaca TaxID=47857 RepID=UPI00378EE02C